MMIDDDDDDDDDEYICNINNDNDDIVENNIAVCNLPYFIENKPLINVPTIPPISLYNISSLAILIFLYSIKYKYVQSAIVLSAKYVNNDEHIIIQNVYF